MPSIKGKIEITEYGWRLEVEGQRPKFFDKINELMRELKELHIECMPVERQESLIDLKEKHRQAILDQYAAMGKEIIRPAKVKDCPLTLEELGL